MLFRELLFFGGRGAAVCEGAQNIYRVQEGGQNVLRWQRGGQKMLTTTDHGKTTPLPIKMIGGQTVSVSAWSYSMCSACKVISKSDSHILHAL